MRQRDEREHLGHGDSLEKQRGVGAKALPHDGRPQDSAETKPTTFEALTLVEAMSGALCEVTPSEAAGWFDHCGYEVEVQYL
jgi:hypothetical protein